LASSTKPSSTKLPAVPERGRVVGERLQQRLVDEADRRLEVDARRVVVADVAVGQQAALALVVEAGRGVADVALGEQVAQRVGEVVRVGDDRAHRREHAFGELVHERVREEVARGVRGVAVGEGEDLELLLVRPGRAGLLRLPGLVEDAAEPRAGVDGVDRALAEHEVREAVGADGARVVVARVLLQRLEHARVDVVLVDVGGAVGALALDVELAVLEQVLAHVLGDLDVRVRLEGHLGERVVGAHLVGVLVAEQVPELVLGEVGEMAAPLRGVVDDLADDLGDVRAEAEAGVDPALDLVAEHERDVARIGVAVVDPLRETEVVAERVEGAVGGAEEQRGVDAFLRALEREADAVGRERALERREQRGQDVGFLTREVIGRLERVDVDGADGDGALVADVLGALEREVDDLSELLGSGGVRVLVVGVRGRIRHVVE
jgi:hypothetical protein